MSELLTLQDLANGHLDVKALGEAANGDENTIVTTRTGETYPSAKKAIKTMFENGGLPATPFKTKALLTASALADGAYAWVTDDADALNGLYIKQAGTWGLSKYNIKNSLTSYLDGKINYLETGSRYQQATVEPIANSIINTASNNNTILVASTGNSYIKINVKDVESLTVSNAAQHVGTWFWVFADAANNKLSVVEKTGNITVSVPKDAVYAYRTFKYTATGFLENANIKIVVKKISPTLLDINNDVQGIRDDVDELPTMQVQLDYILNGDAKKPAIYKVIAGAAVVTDESRPNILSYSSGASYAKVDVSGAKAVEIKGARTDVSQWRWAIIDANDNRIGFSPSVGNQQFSLPAKAAYILKTHEVVASGVKEFESITVSVTPVVPSLKVLDAKVARLSDERDNDSIARRQKMIEKLTLALAQGNTLKASEFAGVTRHDKIENALKFVKLRGHGIIELDGGLWVRNSAILLPDNCWLYLKDAELKLADGVFDNLVRNEGIVVNPDPYGLATQLNPTYNVRVFGNNMAMCKLTGNLDNPYTAPRPQATDTTPVPWVGDDYGWRTVLLLLANTKDYKIHDLHFNKSTCWNISQEHGCDNFEVYNLDFSSYAKNGDGIDMRVGCSNGRVHDISGITADDMVAMTALQGYETSWPNNENIFSMQVGGYLDRGFGTDIHDIEVSRIGGKGFFNGVRVLCSGGSQAYNIAIDDVTDVGGAFGHALVVVSSGYGALAKMGDVRNITVDGVHSTYSPKAVWLQHNIKDSYINNVTQLKVGAVAVDDSSTKVNVTIDNVVDPA